MADASQESLRTMADASQESLHLGRLRLDQDMTDSQLDREASALLAANPVDAQPAVQPAQRIDTNCRFFW